MDDEADSPGRKRWLAIGRFAGARIVSQVRRTPRQTAAMIGLVAITIALLVIVTGISVALADTAPTGDEVDVRVHAGDGTTLSPVVAVEGPRLSDVHDRTATIDARNDVDYATPVLMEVLEVRTLEADEPTTVLAVGVVPHEESPPVAGVPTDSLDPGDPHYANGSYDGRQTGDVVLSAEAAAQLEASETQPLLVRSPRTGTVSQTHEVTAVENATSAGVGSELPVVVLRLSELQSLTGAAGEDLADQVLVGTKSADAKAAIDEVYPNATVESDTGRGMAALRDANLALATSAVALITALGICALFVTTSSSLLVNRERRTLAVLAALGFPSRSRLAVVSVMTLTLTTIGGIVGIALGYVSIVFANSLATATVTSSAIATTDPLFIPYALAAALSAGLLALPYPLYLTAKTDVITELQR